MENRKRPGSAAPVSPSAHSTRSNHHHHQHQQAGESKRSRSNGSSSHYSPGPPSNFSSPSESVAGGGFNRCPKVEPHSTHGNGAQGPSPSPNHQQQQHHHHHSGHGERRFIPTDIYNAPRPPSEERAASVTSLASGGGGEGGAARTGSTPSATSGVDSNHNNNDPSPAATTNTTNNTNTRNTSYCTEMMRTMNEFRDANILCDATICVGGKTFTAHRTVLASASPYFKALFSSTLGGPSMDDACSNNGGNMVESKPIILTDVSADCMTKLLDYIYTGEIELCQDTIKDVISASNYLLITSLKERCTHFLQKILTPINCLGIETTATQFDCNVLRDTATGYIRDNFITVSGTDEFLALDVNRLRSLVESDATRVDREEQIYEAIMKWVEHDMETRRTHFKDLITNVRFPLISPYYLMDHVESNDIVRSTPECIALLLEAKNYHMLPDRRGQLKSSRTVPRHSMGIVNGIIAVGGIQGPCSSVVASTSCYLLCRNQWFVLSKMQTPRCRHGLAVTGEFVYAAGGQYREGAAQSSLANVERYDPKTNTWSAVSQMLTRRSLLNLAALEGFLYAVGGCDENNMRLSSVERYNPSTDSWKFIPNMSTSRSSPSVATDKFIYVIGGVNYVGMSLSCAERYDPRTNTWSRISSMNCCRASACCAIVNGKIYVIGGWDGKTHLNTGECYDPKTEKWTFISPALSARWDAGVAVDSEKLFLVGGCDRNAVCTLETECYNTETDTWSTVASLPVATHGLKCCTVQLPSKFV